MDPCMCVYVCEEGGRKTSRGSLPGDLEESGLRLPGNPREHYRIGTRGRVRVTRPRGGKQRRKGIL